MSADWEEHAICKGHTARMYIGVFEQLAKATCAVCPVRLDCLEAGIDEQYGIWGGLNLEERRRVKEKRKRRKAAA